MTALTAFTRGCARPFTLTVVLGAALLVAAATAVLVPSASAQEPLTAKIFFKNLPPAPVPTFDLTGTSNITVVIQVKNPGSSPVLATKGTFDADFWRRLFVTDPQGSLGTFTGPLAHPDTQPFFCHSRQGVLQRPTAVPMAPVESIPAGATVEWEVEDLRDNYTVNQTGRYVVQLRSPVITVVPASATALITDCDQGGGQTFIDLAADTAAGRTHFMLESNQLEFFVRAANRFDGFYAPVINDTQCANASVTPCQTVTLNATVVLKFKLYDASNAPVTNAVATVSATQLTGAPPLQPPSNLGRGPRADNQFKYDPSAGQYVFTLNTKVLAVGVWRLDATVSDGSVHSVHIAVR